MTLQEFINTYTGKAGVGNTPENKGECVGLISVWFDNLQLPHVWGHARDLITNADPNAYEKIYNSPTNFPIPGDVICWNNTWGGGYGHTGVVVSADANTMKVFEQNNPTGSTPHIMTHPNYNGVIGWLRKKGGVPVADNIDDVRKARDTNWNGWQATLKELDVVRKARDDNWNQLVATKEELRVERTKVKGDPKADALKTALKEFLS